MSSDIFEETTMRVTLRIAESISTLNILVGKLDKRVRALELRLEEDG